ncbi:MAG: DUF4388 domain-containing protein [Candidatus Eisenbacteria bacterium]|nr:DUF4388 domain-containing protein [Candidatus Eisenbacteria bacterium]
MALVGSLRDLSLIEVLQILGGSRRTGVLSVRSELGRAQVHFRDGMVVRTIAPMKEELLGQILMKRGKITREQLMEALKRQEADKRRRRLGPILLEMKLITEQDRDEALAHQVEEALYHLCTWQVGFFWFDCELKPDSSPISLRTEALIEEVRRRAAIAESLEAKEVAVAAEAESVDSLPDRKGVLTPDKKELIKLFRDLRKKVGLVTVEK